MILIESATIPHSFNSLSCAGENLGVLAAKIRVWRQKIVIICAIRAGANLRVLMFKISVLEAKIIVFVKK